MGAGGIGNPAALALATAGGMRFLLADDDAVEAGNLHRQILYTKEDIGRPKVEALAAALRSVRADLEIAPVGRALPETVTELVARADVVLDGTDNFASRFLLADACFLGRRPIVHAAAVRWTGTVTVVSATGAPCYRCFFEEPPEDGAPDCESAGVIGPLCGVVGGVAAGEVLRLLGGDEGGIATLTTFDAKTARFRRLHVAKRPGCPLCGASPSISSIDRRRYTAPSRAR